MSDLILSEKHYSREIEADVTAICKPLNRYGINYFNYSRIYNAGSAFLLVSHWESLANHINKQYQISPPVSKDIKRKNFHYLPFVEDIYSDKNPVFREYAEQYHLGYPIYFIETYKDYMDLYIFGGTAGDFSIINFYLNNIHMLEKFKFYFKDKARKLIEKSDKNRIILPPHMRSDFNALENTNKDEPIENAFDIKQFILPGKYSNLSVTKREVEVIRYLTAGCTIKEAAKQMGLSPRTVEEYLNNVKTKLSLEKKSEIINFMSEFNLL